MAETDQIIRETGFLSVTFFRFVEHEIHDDNHGGPKQHLLVPEEDFSIMEEDGCKQEGAAHQAVAKGQIFDDRVGPYGDPAEINQEGNDVDLESWSLGSNLFVTRET